MVGTVQGLGVLPASEKPCRKTPCPSDGPCVRRWPCHRRVSETPGLFPTCAAGRPGDRKVYHHPRRGFIRQLSARRLIVADLDSAGVRIHYLGSEKPL